MASIQAGQKGAHGDMDLGLTGKVALVTGIEVRGIGRGPSR